MNKKHQRIISIILFFLSLFFSFFDIIFDLESIVPMFGTPLMCFGICLFVYSFDWDKKARSKTKMMYHRTNAINRQIQEKIALNYKFADLENAPQNIKKIFFNNTYTERVIIYQFENVYRVLYQKIEFLDDEYMRILNKFAIWQNYEKIDGVYDSVETAEKENSLLLKYFIEEEIH